MITTITCNPSIDKAYFVDNFKPGTVMRVSEVIATPGGKGINVAKVATLAGADVTATGFLGGYSGKFIESELDKLSIKHEFTWCNSETRTCINIIESQGKSQTELLEPGSQISSTEVDCFFNSYLSLLSRSKVISISGSVPRGINSELYIKLIESANKSNIPVLLDTSGELLVNSIKAKPTLIKPNEDELAQLLGKKLENTNDIVNAAKVLVDYGIKYVVVSLGSKGAVLVTEDSVYIGTVPNIKVVNAVGSGDSMVAGFATGILQNLKIEQTFTQALAIATSNAMQTKTGFFTQEDYENILPKVKLESL